MHVRASDRLVTPDEAVRSYKEENFPFWAAAHLGNILSGYPALLNIWLGIVLGQGWKYNVISNSSW